MKYERHAIISKRRRYLIVFLLHHQSSFDVEKIISRQRVQILLLYGYLVAMLKCSIGIRIVRVSLKFDDAVVKDRLIGNIQDISHSYDEIQRF